MSSPMLYRVGVRTTTITHAVRTNAGEFIALNCVNHVGFGSDFDGGSYLLDDARQVPKITRGLAARGWPEPNLRKFLGLNHLRVFREVCG